jgi:hypothetical protein
MKTRLLKSVRKRFEITHMPLGCIAWGERYNYNLFKLTDVENPHWERYVQLGLSEDGRQFTTSEYIFTTEQDCINSLKMEIVQALRNEGYTGRKDSMMEKSCKKVWP